MGDFTSIGSYSYRTDLAPNTWALNRLASLLLYEENTFVGDPLYYSVANLGHYSLHEINTGNYSPISLRSDLSDHEDNLLREKVEQLLSTGHLVRCYSQWSAAAYTRYIDGELELSIDYNPLNNVTKKITDIIIPNVSSVIGSIYGPSRWFSKIVIKDGFHQIALDQDSQEKTAFQTSFGQYKFRTYHYGMKNAGFVLQNLMDNVIGGADDNIKYYLGHVLIHTNSIHHHFDIVEEVLGHISGANLKVDVSKSSLFTHDVDYLGYYINEDGIWIPNDKIEKILRFRKPNNQTELRRFLGLINQYKGYIDYFQQIAQPLYDLTNPNTRFYWNNGINGVFNQVKDLISELNPIVPF